MSRKTKYDTDFYAWAIETAKLIRDHKLSEVDLENVAEEIESVGKSQKHELVNRLSVLICHLLKWRFQPGKQGGSWRRTIAEQRMAIQVLLEDNPSLKHDIETIYDRSCKYGRIAASTETGMPEKFFPEVCPYRLEEVLDLKFLPESE